MTERLTKRLPDEFDGKWINLKENDGGSADIHYNDYEIGMFYDAIAKLADLEDLEEQGRLVVLPEGFDTTEFLEMIATQPVCPKRLGLKDYDGTETCDWDVSTCKECWEKALKGE